MRAETPFGEIALRRRNGVTELVVNGVFAMDSVEVTSELALADAAGRPPGRVLVGGLGLGYTTARLLDAGADLVRVVELAAPLVEWARAGATRQLGRVAADPRVELVVGDVADEIAGAEPGWDSILLDVDNGPSFLIHDHNQRVYSAAFLNHCLHLLRPGGRLVMNFVTLENLATATAALADAGAAWDVVQLQASRSQPILDMHRLAAHNPVWVMSADKDTP